MSLKYESIIKQMSLEEKALMMSGKNTWETVDFEKYGIPSMAMSDGPHGLRRQAGAGDHLGLNASLPATCFPTAASVANSWDEILGEEIGTALAEEAVTMDVNVILGPGLNIKRSPLCGRNFEYFSEDPYLTGVCACEITKGVQNSRPVIVCPKHFAANEQETFRRGNAGKNVDAVDSILTERALREQYLKPFEMLVKDAGIACIMTSFNKINGSFSGGSHDLCTHILREEWGFDGFIVSDCGAIGNLTARKHYTAKDKIEAANQALAAGIATNCGDTYNDKEVIQAAKDGRINMENLDEVCRTMLRMMFRNELFEKTPNKPLDWNKIYPGWNSDSHKEMARQAARESIVMLENKDNILPLAKDMRTIAVVGPGADDLQPGDYTPKLLPGQLKSVLTGIKQAVGKQTKVVYEQGCDFTSLNGTDIPKAVKAASQSDVVVLVLGDCSTSESTTDVYKTSGENHDYATLILPGKQQELLEAVCATGKPVILILQAGRPYNLSKASELCKAILVNWLPGQEGGPATADVLFGDYNPAGRLPLTYYKSLDELPPFDDYDITKGRTYKYFKGEVLYPFGYGLSYSSFKYSDLRVKDEADEVAVSFRLKNTGKRNGDEVTQVYVRIPETGGIVPVKELKGFRRVPLKSGESRRVEIRLNKEQLRYWDVGKGQFVVPKGTFDIMVGASSKDIRLQTVIDL